MGHHGTPSPSHIWTIHPSACHALADAFPGFCAQCPSQPLSYEAQPWHVSLSRCLGREIPSRAFRIQFQPCLSADSIEATEDDEALGLCPTEHLNSLGPSGCPPHALHSKPGVPIMFLRNLSPQNNLVNGYRLISHHDTPARHMFWLQRH